MSSKTTWSLVIAAGILLALICFVEHPIRQERQRPVSRLVLPHIDPASATSVSVRPANQMEISVLCRSNTWRLAKPIEYPADGDRIQNLLIALSALQWQGTPITADDLKDRVNGMEEFGFVTPQVSVEIQDANGSHTLRVGTNSALGDQVFIQVGGSEVIYTVKPDILKLIPLSKDLWRDTTLVRLENVPFDVISVRSGPKAFELQRDSQGLWRFRKPLQQARADTQKIETLLAQLQSLRVTNFVTDAASPDLEPYGFPAATQVLAPGFRLSLLQNTNTTPLFELQTGGSPTNHPELVFVRRSNPGNILLVPSEPLALWQSDYTVFLDHHLISTPASQIESIEVGAPGSTNFTLRRNESGWTVEPVRGQPFKADAGLMDILLNTFTNAPTELEKTVAASFDTFVIPPILVYTLHGARESAPTNLIAQFQFGTNQAGRVFEHRIGEDSVNTLGADEYEHLPRASWQLRDRHIWSFASSNVTTITINQLGKTKKYIRDPNNEWTFSPGLSAGSKHVNPFSIEDTLRRLGDLTAVYWNAEGDMDLESFGFAEASYKIEIEIRTASGLERLELQLGKLSPWGHPYASVVMGGARRVFEFPADVYSGMLADFSTLPETDLRRR